MYVNYPVTFLSFYIWFTNVDVTICITVIY